MNIIFREQRIKSLQLQRWLQTHRHRSKPENMEYIAIRRTSNGEYILIDKIGLSNGLRVPKEFIINNHIKVSNITITKDNSIYIDKSEIYGVIMDVKDIMISRLYRDYYSTNQRIRGLMDVYLVPVSEELDHFINIGLDTLGITVAEFTKGNERYVAYLNTNNTISYIKKSNIINGVIKEDISNKDWTNYQLIDFGDDTAAKDIAIPDGRMEFEYDVLIHLLNTHSLQSKQFVINELKSMFNGFTEESWEIIKKHDKFNIFESKWDDPYTYTLELDSPVNAEEQYKPDELLRMQEQLNQDDKLLIMGEILSGKTYQAFELAKGYKEVYHLELFDYRSIIWNGAIPEADDFILIIDNFKYTDSANNWNRFISYKDEDGNTFSDALTDFKKYKSEHHKWKTMDNKEFVLPEGMKVIVTLELPAYWYFIQNKQRVYEKSWIIPCLMKVLGEPFIVKSLIEEDIKKASKLAAVPVDVLKEFIEIEKHTDNTYYETNRSSEGLTYQTVANIPYIRKFTFLDIKDNINSVLWRARKIRDTKAFQDFQIKRDILGLTRDSEE